MNALFPCITEDVVAHFKPTWLYVKRHVVTGLMYFGKSSTKNPMRYKGSGTYWLRHIKKHGEEQVETIWTELFTDVHCLVEFALLFSEHMDIVSSERWANLMPENGISSVMTEKTAKKISEALTGRKIPEEVILKRSATLKANITSSKTVIRHRKLSPEEREAATEKSRKTRASWTEEQQLEYAKAQRKALTGKKRTVAQCNNIRNGLLSSGYSPSPETRAKIGAKQQGVIKPIVMRFTLRSPTNEEVIYEGKVAALCDQLGIGVKYLYLSLKNNTPIKRGKGAGWQLLKKERLIPSPR